MKTDRFKDPKLDRTIQALAGKPVSMKKVNAEPKENTGELGELRYYDDGTDFHLYLKTPRGWAEFTTMYYLEDDPVAT